MPAAVVKDGTVTPKFRQGKISPPFLTAKFSPRNSPLAKFPPPLYQPATEQWPGWALGRPLVGSLPQQGHITTLNLPFPALSAPCGMVPPQPPPYFPMSIVCVLCVHMALLQVMGGD